MCGIIGILGKGDVAASILTGLKRLEYRGYDSAGIATLSGGRIDRRRAPGKLGALARKLDDAPLSGASGIGHTRWATHGAANETNAHPHATDRLVLVHNGIIENFAELRAELEAAGIHFETDTDTEVVAQLITHYLADGNMTPRAATARALDRLTGAFGLAILFAGEDDLMIAARRGSPLAIGHGDGAVFVGSDAYALAPFTRRVTYLEDGDFVVLTRDTITITDRSGATVSRPETLSAVTDNMVDKDGHRHFMAKEIHEQPDVIAHTLSHYIDTGEGIARIDQAAFDFASLDRLTISACGTAYYAGLIAKYWFESWARLPVEIDIASELRYRDVPYTAGGGALFISQSGETADTLAALRNARAHGQKIAAVVNVPESSIAREADVVLPTMAGPEIGVASTKAFTCQLAALASIALAAGAQRGTLSLDEQKRLTSALLSAPRLVANALSLSGVIEDVARDLAKVHDVLYLGRGSAFPLAMEGALKLKEISYIHAEGYAAGELKHGPIALIDEKTPVVVLAPPDKHFEKTISNMHEVIARDGKTILMTDESGAARAGDKVWRTIIAPACDPAIVPLVYAVPVQLLAYFTATTKGTDVDQPRNLAKSVTVE